MGRSKAQDALQEKIEEVYPMAFVEDEVYIGKLIEERGYTVKEIERELGGRMHRMFVDIVLRDSERTVAFEYHGEQHYSIVGNMTKTGADVLVNQQLDQEKSWILSRIGIPIVAVPFDMYIDDSVLEELIAKATEECLEGRSTYIECDECHRAFPPSQFATSGICKSCVEGAKEREERERRDAEREEAAQARRERARERREARKASKTEGDKDGSSSGTAGAWRKYAASGDAEEDAKEMMRERRRAEYRAWKESPEYAEQKERARQARHEAYQKAKAEAKRRGKKR